MSAATEKATEFELPLWLQSEIWAQACNKDGDVVEIPRSLIDMGGRVVFKIPEGVEAFLVSANVYTAAEEGVLIRQVRFPVPRRVSGPTVVHCTLDEFSH